MTIRPARSDELARLQEIEVAAGRAFVDAGMPEVADDPPPSIGALEAHRAAGGLWVVDEGEGAVAYLVLETLDGRTHVEQVSVHPAAAGRGLGRVLLDHAATLAAAAGRSAVTLTTFRDVPWNAPYYERRCGFRILPEDAIGPELARRMADEAAHGLDAARRVAMARTVGSLTGPG
jgi:ribosomal protein S18 acetylase RimI-like enzyme